MEFIDIYKWEKLSFGILIISSLLFEQTLQTGIQGNVVWKECNVELPELRVLSQLSFSECVNACNARSKCSSVKYQQRYNICHLFTSDVTVTANVNVTDGNWHGTCAYVGVHHNSSNTQQPGLFSCANCCKDEMCDEQQAICSFQECGNISAPNTSFLGNQNHVGALRRIVCEPGTTEVNNEQFVRCNSNGQWNYTPSCLPNTTAVYNGLSSIDCPKTSWEWFIPHENVPTFTLALVKSVVNFSDAQAACQAQNSAIVKVNETWKQETVHYLLNTCNGFHQVYWIDGVKNQNDTEWRFSDNSLVPNLNFWLNGDSGASDGGKNCIRATTDGFWLTFNCSSAANFICEKQI